MRRPATRALPFAIGLAACCAATRAQQAPAADAAPALRLELATAVFETVTDNARLSSDKRSDAITELRVSLHGLVRGGRVQGFAAYSVSGSAFARESEHNDVRQSLASRVQAQLVERTLSVDLHGDISQSAGSAFGTQSLEGVSGSARADGNRYETASASVSPHLTGHVRDLVDIDARYSLLASRSRGTDVGDHTERTAQLQLGHRIGRDGRWGLSASSQRVDYVLGRDTQLDMVEVSGGLRLLPELELGVLGGQQWTDLASLQREHVNTWGATLRWTPTERTKVDAVYRQTFFGHSHSLLFSHRTPLTAWTVSDERDLSSGNGQAAVSMGSAYDLLFEQLATQEPDPAKRDVLVRNFLAARGIDPRVDVQTPLLVSAVTLRRQQTLSGALNGRRTTLMLRVARTQTQRLSDLDRGSALGDLRSNDRIRQDAVTVNLTHQLAPTQSAGLLAAWSHNTGDVDRQTSTLKTALATWNWRLSPRSTLATTLRHARFDSPTSPYRENALTVAFTRRF